MEENAPVTVEDFLVPTDTPPVAAEAAEQTGQETPPNGESPDQRSEEEKLLDELAAEPEAEEPAAEENIPPPPNSWSKDDADAWKAMPPEAREIVARREKERDAFVANKGREYADQRRSLENQAMEAVAQQADQFSAQLQAYMVQNAPMPPDTGLLYTNDPNDVVIYQRQDAAHKAALAQHQEMQQRVVMSQQQALEARRQVEAANASADAERLRQTLPEFFDPEASATLRQSLESVADELGYPPELRAQAGSTDILALKKAAEWRDKAMRFDKIMAKRMESVRGAKTLPKMTRPGAAPTQALNAEANADREAAAIAQFQRDRSGEAALSLLAVRKR